MTSNVGSEYRPVPASFCVCGLWGWSLISRLPSCCLSYSPQQRRSHRFRSHNREQDSRASDPTMMQPEAESQYYNRSNILLVLSIALSDSQCQFYTRWCLEIRMCSRSTRASVETSPQSPACSCRKYKMQKIARWATYTISTENVHILKMSTCFLIFLW